MTDRAQPGAKGSNLKNIEMGEVFGTLGWNKVIRASEPTRAAQNDSNIDETTFNEFAATYSSSSLTVTIDPGEAMVDGWVARDTSTDVDLASSTSGQTVYVGWDTDAFYDDTQHDTRDDADAVIIGLDSAFGASDPQLSLWTFDTDSSGVTNAVDERNYTRPLGGVSFVQDQQPAHEEGLDWYDTGDGKYYVADGTDWQPVPEEGEGSGLNSDLLRGMTPSDLVPPNMITIWSGALSEIPAGWVLCDGNNGTPDLTDRFVVGAGGSYTVGDTGGSDTVQLTESEMPSHSHSYDKNTHEVDSGSGYVGRNHTSNATTGSAGGDSAHENRPPYYALAYMMKV